MVYLEAGIISERKFCQAFHQLCFQNTVQLRHQQFPLRAAQHMQFVAALCLNTQIT